MVNQGVSKSLIGSPLFCDNCDLNVALNRQLGALSNLYQAVFLDVLWVICPVT